ncbi:hypothetical protein CEP54_013934 [Fusarium duplospermum]|uniref:Uncharacterized protein n=1 Tax=Fusarium duplospermum TaxID=1325734 RepID=A0A428NZG7_9HYPO|nr:hypothetical protein CEP54_013934 [Fusarium duplospermum]
MVFNKRQSDGPSTDRRVSGQMLSQVDNMERFNKASPIATYIHYLDVGETLPNEPLRHLAKERIRKQPLNGS